jgi:heat shock protein 1/8
MDLVDTLIKTADKESHSRYTDRVDKANINRVIISGSGARMPGVPNLLENHLGKAPTDPPGISPGHAVVIGAAKRAQVMQHNDMHRDEQCTSLLDLAPLPLGVETAGGIVTHVSGGAGDFPFEKRFMFTTTVDEQEGIKFRVLEGLSLEPRYNKILSTFKVQVPPAPKGVAHVSQTLLTTIKDQLS